MTEIQVLGTGHRGCAALFENARTAVSLDGRDDAIAEKVTDIDRVAEVKPWDFPH
jgi:hypothetical protein